MQYRFQVQLRVGCSQWKNDTIKKNIKTITAEKKSLIQPSSMQLLRTEKLII